MNLKNPHLTAAIVGLAAALLATVGLRTVTTPAPVVQVVSDPSMSSRATARLAAAAWGELKQSEIDAITAALKPNAPGVPVTVFCLDDRLCGDMALDLENAFESAHWKISRQRPLADDTKGIGTNDEKMAALIEKATGGRLKPVIIKTNLKDSIAITIGAKSR